jgi:hypothetical protein
LVMSHARRDVRSCQDKSGIVSDRGTIASSTQFRIMN